MSRRAGGTGRPPRTTSSPRTPPSTPRSERRLQRDAARGGADAVGEAVDRVLEFAVRAEGEGGDRDRGRCRRPRSRRWHEDQISSGWSGPHSCQALRTAAALDHGQDMIRRDALRGRVGPEAELGDDAEVAVARAAQGPEEVLVLGRARGQLLAVRRDQRRLGEAVAGQAVRPGHDAVAAAEGQAGDADGRAGTGRDRHALRGRARGRRRSAWRPRRPRPSSPVARTLASFETSTIRRPLPEDQPA